jgi:putative endonuclease
MFAKNKGLFYEQQAEKYLIQQGLTPLEKNYHCRYGEIDLIMLDAGYLCFIEVKFRKNDAFGGTAYSIPASKQRKIIQTALHYVSRKKQYQQHPYRFDAVFIQQADRLRSAHTEWIQSAFEASGYS